jgi:hypothetical protein
MTLKVTVTTPHKLTSSLLTSDLFLWLLPLNSESDCCLSLSLSLMLRPTVGPPICLGIKHPFVVYDQICITVRQLQVCWCGALSLTRGPVCRLQLLLALASAVIHGSDSRGIREHTCILLSQIRDFPFRRLLRLAGLRWKYLTPPPHDMNSVIAVISDICLSDFCVWHNPSADRMYDTALNS